MHMLALHGAKERTQPEYAELLCLHRLIGSHSKSTLVPGYRFSRAIRHRAMETTLQKIQQHLREHFRLSDHRVMVCRK